MGTPVSYKDLGNVDLMHLGGPRLAEVGKIKIGGKGRTRTSQKGNQYRLPVKYDHFVITTNFRDANGDFTPDREIMKKIASMTGQDPQKLTRLPVVLLFDDPTMNFFVRYSCYKGNSPWCVGDGQKALRQMNGAPQQVPCPCERSAPNYQGNERCKVYGRLAVVLRGVERLGGCWMFRTTSWNTCKNILSAMHLFRQITGGILAGIPLEMTINPKTVITPEGKQQTVWVVNLEFPGTWEQLAEHGLRIHRKRLEYRIKAEMLEDQVRRQLAALPGLPEDEEGGVTPEDIQEEFYPENGVGEAAESEAPAAKEPVITENGSKVDPETGEVLGSTAAEQPEGETEKGPEVPSPSGGRQEAPQPQQAFNSELF